MEHDEKGDRFSFAAALPIFPIILVLENARWFFVIVNSIQGNPAIVKLFANSAF